jgi:hypothetical protein
MPLEAAQSVNSPQSIWQSANDGVGLGGHPLIPEGEGLTVDSISTADSQHVVSLTAATNGDVYVAYVVDGAVVGVDGGTLMAGEAMEFAFPDSGAGDILISFIDEQGRVQAIAESVAP